MHLSIFCPLGMKGGVEGHTLRLRQTVPDRLIFIHLSTPGPGKSTLAGVNTKLSDKKA